MILGVVFNANVKFLEGMRWVQINPTTHMSNMDPSNTDTDVFQLIQSIGYMEVAKNCLNMAMVCILLEWDFLTKEWDRAWSTWLALRREVPFFQVRTISRKLRT
jgi:hypothetical protein